MVRATLLLRGMVAALVGSSIMFAAAGDACGQSASSGTQAPRQLPPVSPMTTYSVTTTYALPTTAFGAASVVPASFTELEGTPVPTPATSSAPAQSPPAALSTSGCGCNGGCGDDCGCGCAAPRGCDRWYLSIAGGWQHRETVHEANDPQTFIVFDSGFSMNAALGYRFDVFRIEAEYSFMNNETAEAGAAGNASTSTGNVNLRAFMFNIYHDMDINGWCWKPYLGAGIGIYQSELNALYPAFFANIPPQFGSFQTTPINATSNMPFAYQFRAGASRPLGERAEFYTGYRYFHGEELTFAAAPFAGPAAPTFHPNGAWTHGVEFGLRVRF